MKKLFVIPVAVAGALLRDKEPKAGNLSLPLAGKASRMEAAA